MLAIQESERNGRRNRAQESARPHEGAKAARLSAHTLRGDSDPARTPNAISQLPCTRSKAGRQSPWRRPAWAKGFATYSSVTLECLGSCMDSVEPNAGHLIKAPSGSRSSANLYPACAYA